MTEKETEKIFIDFAKAMNDLAIALGKFAIVLNQIKRTKTNHKRKPSRY